MKRQTRYIDFGNIIKTFRNETRRLVARTSLVYRISIFFYFFLLLNYISVILEYKLIL